MNIIMGNNSSAFDHLPIFFPTCLLSLKGKKRKTKEKKLVSAASSCRPRHPIRAAAPPVRPGLSSP